MEVDVRFEVPAAFLVLVPLEVRGRGGLKGLGGIFLEVWLGFRWTEGVSGMCIVGVRCGCGFEIVV